MAQQYFSSDHSDRTYEREGDYDSQEFTYSQQRSFPKHDDGENYVLVAAIDFGTTFSGYAFSFKSSPDDVRMNKNWSETMGFQSYKTPTSVLTGPDDKFMAFGYEAEHTYVDTFVYLVV